MASDTQRSALGSTTSGKRSTLKSESMVKAVWGVMNGEVLPASLVSS
jgi:hypothetical protein